MPRAPRQKSDSAMYHIIFRGINQQVIFVDDKEYDAVEANFILKTNVHMNIGLIL